MPKALYCKKHIPRCRLVFGEVKGSASRSQDPMISFLVKIGLWRAKRGNDNIPFISEERNATASHIMDYKARRILVDPYTNLSKRRPPPTLRCVPWTPPTREAWFQCGSPWPTGEWLGREETRRTFTLTRMLNDFNVLSLHVVSTSIPNKSVTILWVMLYVRRHQHYSHRIEWLNQCKSGSFHSKLIWGWRTLQLPMVMSNGQGVTYIVASRRTVLGGLGLVDPVVERCS